LEQTRDPQTRTESKTRLVERVNAFLRSGNYSRALDMLRGAAAGFPDDVDLPELEKLAQDGIQRKGEADRLITDSQGLFAQRKSGEAIQLLRKAYELDKTNTLARSILANALVEHANSIVEIEWWGAENLAKEALALNPAHPTAKTIYSLIIERKKASSVEEWVSRAGKLQSSGDLFAALAWVAEGLAVHPDDPKLLQIQHAIQREQAARRRQTRRSDLQDLRQMEVEIGRAAGPASKQALAERIQALAAKYWTDGEILSLANGVLSRLGLGPEASPNGTTPNKAAPVIFHVPLPKPPGASGSHALASPVSANETAPKQVSPKPIPQRNTIPVAVAPTNVAPSIAPPKKVETAAPEAQFPAAQAAVPESQPSAPAAKAISPSPQRKQPIRSTFAWVITVPVCGIILLAAIFFFPRKHPVAQVATAPAVAPTNSAQETGPAAPPTSHPAVSASPETTPEAAPPVSSDTAAEKTTPDNPSPADSGRNLGTLVIVAGQDGASVFLNGKPQRQLTQSGQLRLPNLEPKDYVVKVTKPGFQDPPQQEIRIREGEQARLIFNLQPQPRLASLMIRGGTPGTLVLIDQDPVGTIQADGTLSVSTVNPGDRTVELRKDRFKPRQVKKHFVAGAAITLAAADAALEAASGQLRITFSPPDANVAIAKDEFLKIVSSGVPLILPPGTYTLTARTAERFTRSATFEVEAGQSKTVDLSLAPSGMSKWDDPGVWKHDGDAYTRKGGDFVLYGVVPASGTFVFSAMPKGRLIQWVLNYAGRNNYMLFQLDDKNFYRCAIRNGQKTDEIIVPHKGDKKTFRTLQVRVSPTEVVHMIKDGESWTVLDRWTQPGAKLSAGKFGFYLPGNEQVALSSFAHYADLNLH
jgi:Flp pilus assembly protein TadD